MKKIFLLALVITPMLMCAQIDTTRQLQVLTGYYNDWYSSPYNRTLHVFYGGFGYKSPNTSIYGKINYNTLSKELVPKTSGFQYELDYYQRITKSTTSWWNYAYSNGNNFPNHRFMMRLWQELPSSFLVSGGMSYYNFDGSDTYSLNGGIEKYFGNYWLEYRTFVYFLEPNNTYSHFLTARRFIKDVNYIQLMIGYGPNDDNPWDNDYSKLIAYRTGLLYVTNLGNKFRIRTGVNYMYENYSGELWRNRYSVIIGLTYNIN